MKRMKTSDYILGTFLGVICVLIVGKLWIVPDMTIVEILKIIVESQIGWSW